MAKASYKDAGVDLELYRQAMGRLPPLMHRTFTPRVIPLDGGFAGLFQLDFANHLFARNYRDPVLVSCTDGVGTKLKVAQLVGRHNTVGIDLVAMSVNDALCCGAEPLFFLDYVAMSHDDPALLEQIVDGISNGCLQADCALLGGETAIMPDLYARGDYDLAGFCVGVVERQRIIDGREIAVGDVVIGVASSGLHSNGYSLARKIVFDIAKLKATDDVDELGGYRRRSHAHADADLCQSRSQRFGPLQNQGSRPRHRPHHRRRLAGKLEPHSARESPRHHPTKQLADSAGLSVAAKARRG